MDQICVISAPCSGEIEVKKSRFLASIVPISSQEEAMDYIAARKKKYWDARHNCYAFILEGIPLLERCSDDSEPQGTAGKPMLSVLQGAHLVNVCAVVTRYFGGTLLGTGGLVKAYSDAVAQALRAGEVLTRYDGAALTVGCTYTDLGKIQYLISQAGAYLQDIHYTDNVVLRIVISRSDAQALKASIREGTADRAEWKEEKQVCFVAGSKGVQLIER